MQAESLQLQGAGQRPKPISRSRSAASSGDLPVRFAPNGGAVPGDRIVGILTPGEGITIYPIQSPALTAFDDQPERWLDVRWDIDADSQGAASRRRSVVTRSTSRAALAAIARVIGDNGGNIDNLRCTARSPDFREIVDRPRGLGPEAPQRHHRRSCARKHASCPRSSG